MHYWALTDEGSYGEAKAKIPQRATDDASSRRCVGNPGAVGRIGRQPKSLADDLRGPGQGQPSIASQRHSGRSMIRQCMLVEVDGAKRTIQVSPGTRRRFRQEDPRQGGKRRRQPLRWKGGTSWFPRRRASVVRGGVLREYRRCALKSDASGFFQRALRAPSLAARRGGGLDRRRPGTDRGRYCGRLQRMHRLQPNVVLPGRRPRSRIFVSLSQLQPSPADLS